MADLSPTFNELLQKQNSSPIGGSGYSLDRINDFLKEAYQVNQRVAELLAYLRSIRKPYLYDGPPPRRRQLEQRSAKDLQYFTDTERDQIDAEAKGVLRDLHAAVGNLSRAEQIRQETDAAVTEKRKRRNGFGVLGSWAAGGGIAAKSPQEQTDEARSNGVKACREGVVWFLQRRLEHCGGVQSSMMEKRINRELEKSKSALYKARGSAPIPVWEGKKGDGSRLDTPGGRAKQGSRQTGVPLHELEGTVDLSKLDEEQIQLLAKENQDLIKHYENKLDQVRTAERSLVEISELQSTLAMNLAVQSAHIDQLIQDSFLTTTNVASGNEQLKRASERGSTARWVFQLTALACSAAIAWDFFI